MASPLTITLVRSNLLAILLTRGTGWFPSSFSFMPVSSTMCGDELGWVYLALTVLLLLVGWCAPLLISSLITPCEAYLDLPRPSCSPGF